MTDELFGDYIYSELKEVFEDSADDIGKKLTAGIDPGKINSDMITLITRSMYISSQLSVQYTLRALEKAGLITLPADGTPILKLHKNPQHSE